MPKVKTGLDRGGHFGYSLKGERLKLEDGFNMAVGREKIPSVTHRGTIPKEKWERIFGKGN